MAKSVAEPAGPSRSVTTDRVSRLARLLNMLDREPRSRQSLLTSLSLDVRGFYRDLQLLRDLGVNIDLHEGRYVLTEELDEALSRLPFPDPKLNLTEAMQLATGGSSAAHKRLRKQIEDFTGRKPKAKAKAKSRKG